MRKSVNRTGINNAGNNTYRVRAGISLAALAAAILFAAVGATARGAPRDDAYADGATRSLRNAFRGLNDSRWKARRRAQLCLMRGGPRVIARIERRLALAPSPEMRKRLVHIALNLALASRTSLRGRCTLLGIAMQVVHLPGSAGASPRAGVLVRSVQPGFPAANSLQRGDILIGMNGARFSPYMDAEQFRLLIARSTPGTVERFVVLRGTRRLTFDIPLAGLPVNASDFEIYMQHRIRMGVKLMGDLWGRAGRPIVLTGRRPYGPAAMLGAPSRPGG